MKRFIKSGQFLFRKLHVSKQPEPFTADEIDEDISLNKLSYLSAKYYRKIKFSTERRRIRKYQLKSEIKDHRILGEIVTHSRPLLAYLLFITLITAGLDIAGLWLVDWLRHFSSLRADLTLPTKAELGTGLQVYIASVSAVLGLIFALFAVSFQLTTDRYSQKVTDFINQEKVSSYYFQFLVFTDLFAIIVYLKLIIFGSLPLISFAAATIFVALSFLGILVFKSHHSNFIKPATMFNRLYSMALESIGVVSDQSSSNSKSWNIIIQARTRVQSYLGIIEALYRDLIRRGPSQTENWNDAAFAPLIASQILRSYTDKKRFIDTNKQSWATEKFEKVRASNLTMYSLKLQYELKGKGPLFTPEADSSWLENRIFNFLDEISNDIQKDSSDQLFVTLSEGYRTVLVGDKQKQVDAPPKTIPGAWQNQEFAIFDRVVRDFVILWQKIDICTSKAVINYLNDYFMVTSEVIEPWNYDKALKVAEGFYIGDQLEPSKKFLRDYNLPAFFRDLLLDYWRRLEIEQAAEGKIITPVSQLSHELKKQFEDKRAELCGIYLALFFETSDQIIRKLAECSNYEVITQFIKVQMEWISHLMYTKQNELAEKFAPNVKENIRYLFLASKETLEDEEMLEQAEKGYFVALQEENKPAFAMYAQSLNVIRVRRSIGETDQNILLREARLPVIWGGHAFALSELRQDTFWVKTIVKELERTFKPDVFQQLMDLVSDRAFSNNIYWETTRYLPWEQAMIGKIKRELTPVHAQGRGEIGFSMVYDHPSVLIRPLADFDIMFDDRAIKGFVEWVKKRDAIKRLLPILNRRGGES
jgi:hypothetical protein